jgi:transposase
LRLDGIAVDVIQAPKTGASDYALRYDADWIRELARQQGAWANIPPKRNRKDLICFSPYLYRARTLIERFFNKINQCRSCRDPIRQTRSQLSGVRQTRINPNLVTR